MDITMMGSINAYTKNLKMQTQWDLKKKSGNVTGHASSAADWLKGRETSSSEEEDDGKKLKMIMQKVYAGGKLSKEEKAYLQTKDPVAYQKLQSIEQEQRSYERELRKCRTREDVQRLKLSRVSASLSAAKSVENNPHISDDKKQVLIGLEGRRCQKLEDSTRAFVKRGEYGRLPTEAEQAKAEKEQREAEEARRCPEQAERRPEPERAKERPEAETRRQTGVDRAEKPVQPETAEKAARPEMKREEKPRTAEPESPEARKVRRAKARAAYAKAEEPPREFPDTLNVKA